MAKQPGQPSQRQCVTVGCGLWFTPTRPDQIFHNAACRVRNGKRKERVRRQYPLPPREFLEPYADQIRRYRAKGAIGFRLYSQELEMFLPVAGALRRDGSRRKTDFFTVDPIEVPLVPFASAYEVHWLFVGGFLMPSHPPQSVSIGWADDMRKHVEVGQRVTEYRKLQKARTVEMFAATEETPALPPHDEGDTDDDGSAS